jgi:hypothetical protein
VGGPKARYGSACELRHLRVQDSATTELRQQEMGHPSDVDTDALGQLISASLTTPSPRMVTPADGVAEMISAGSTGFSSLIDYLYYEVTEEHPILEGFEVGDEVIFDEVTTFKDHAWFEGYADEDEGRRVIADAARDDLGVRGGGIGVDERANNRHVLLSMHAASAFVDPTDWHPDSEQVFLNALNWVAPPPDPDAPVFVEWDLEVVPDVVLGGEPVGVDVRVKNIGGSAGDHDVVLRVDGEVEDTTTVTLGAGEDTAVSWTVTRDELGVYEVAVGPLTETFRVRPPVVELHAQDLDGDPLAGALVELVEDGERIPVGMTDGDGALAFESTDTDASYTIVARHPGAADGRAYLLTREVTVDDDVGIDFHPESDAAADADQQAAVVDLALDAVDDQHAAWAYVRSDATAPFGYAFEPGTLVATTATYEAVHAHAVFRPERDWWYASDIADGLDWTAPTGITHAFGGDAAATLDVAPTGATEFVARWAARDGHGHAFAVVLQTDLRPFAAPPDVLELEDVADALRAQAPDETEVLLRLFDPDGEVAHAGGVAWDERSVERDLADLVAEVAAGTYELEVEVDSGPYGDILHAEDGLTVPLRELSTDRIRARERLHATVTFAAPDEGDVSLTEGLIRLDNDTDWRDVWEITEWSADAPATFDSDEATWTFAADDITAGEELTVTYTIRARRSMPTPSDWRFEGQVTFHETDAIQEVGGDTDVRVQRGGGPPGGRQNR